MKVYIGGYRSHFTTQYVESWWFNARYKKYGWAVEDNERDWLDRAVVSFLDVWQKTVCYPLNVIVAKIPRIEYVKIDNYDIWNMDGTLATIILPMLLELKRVKHGSGHVDDEDVPEALRSTSAPPTENEWDTDENYFKRWDYVLDEMIWAFTQKNDDDNGETPYRKGESHILFQAVDKDGNKLGEPHEIGESPEGTDAATMFEMVKGPKDTMETDYEGLKLHWARIQNGCRLFGKYYSNLWD